MAMFWQISQILFPLFALAMVGYVYARHHKPDMSAPNHLNMTVFLPCLIFSVLVDQSVELASYGKLALGAALIVLGSGVVAAPLARLLGYELKTFVPPMMFNNSGNLGLPLMVLAFGEKALAPAVILFIVENTLHFSVGMKIMNPTFSLRQIVKIPMVAATLLGLAFNGLHIQIPNILLKPIDLIGQIAIPLMLVSLGIRLATDTIKHIHIGLSAAIICPLSGLLSLVIVNAFIDLGNFQWQMLVIYSVLPPAALNFLVAEQFNQQPQQVASMVLIGNLFSVISLPLVLFYLFS